MNRGFKLLTVTLVLGAGIGSALLFRSHASRDVAQRLGRYGSLDFRGDRSRDWGASGQQTPYRLETVRVPAGVRHDPDDSHGDRTPPRLPTQYPRPSGSFVFSSPDGDPRPPAWTPLFGGGSLTVPNEDTSEDRPAAKRTHTIKDGDTLLKLAQRYLGDSQRWRELYEANRNRIADPQLLPIGVVVEIPSEAEQTRLMPIPPGALRRETEEQ